MKLSWIPQITAPVLAVIIISVGFILIYLKPEIKTEVIGLMSFVVAFYFGSSSGSQTKDKTISDALDKKPTDGCG